ncbi:MAG: Lrp/AsnC family transcriptional regulator [Clostridiales bacterium]|jgi:DNA-binding Lrp family transcriptional regulator|nr:Lrp/AsnC family transcriptional regulator [Clostridiales bacterium]
MNKLHTEILKILSDDARTTAEQIAVMLGKERGVVAASILEMERSGIIVKYNLLVNDDKLDGEKVQAWIEVKVTPQKSLGFDSIAEEIYQFPEVKDLYLMSGGYDLAVLVEGKSLKEVAMFVSEKLSAMNTVTGTATHFILKKYKAGGVNIVGGETLKRIPVHE